ncbi:MAG: ABC transporter permease, partial [Planctomycetaceae bacterium]|nr:ABC transporter permease [Planctomycetaceae bacterium]
MYKLLLSSRYLRTRFIALASIISVMLGVATLIVVNSVMAGFRYQMRDRLHALLSDVVIECSSTDGTSDPERLERYVMEEVGEHVEAIAPAVEIYGMLSFKLFGKYIPRPVTIIGIDPERQHAVSPLREFLMGRQPQRDEDGNIIADPVWPADAPLDWSLSAAGQQHRADQWMQRRLIDEVHQESPFFAQAGAESDPELDSSPNLDGNWPAVETEEGPLKTVDVDSPILLDTPAGQAAPHELFGSAPAEGAADLNAPCPARLFVGVGLIGYPHKDEQTGKTDLVMLVRPGDDVILSTIRTGIPEPTRFAGTVVDVFKSGMSEFDSTLVFCPLEE